jgi:hypothetical protein
MYPPPHMSHAVREHVSSSSYDMHVSSSSYTVSLMQCENILFASREVDPELKIADFGLAQLLQRGDKLMAGACKLNPKT